MSKVLARSTKVLDAADRFADILNWQLFAAEQDTRLWGYNEDEEWMPGVPLHTKPTHSVMGALLRGGNHARRMIEEFEDGQKHYHTKCEDCAVDWNDYDLPCWMCGRKYEEPQTDEWVRFASSTFTPRLRSEFDDLVDDIAPRVLSAAWWSPLDVETVGMDRSQLGFVAYCGADVNVSRWLLQHISHAPFTPRRNDRSEFFSALWIQPTAIEREVVDPKAMLRPTAMLFDPTLTAQHPGQAWFNVPCPGDFPRRAPLPRMRPPRDFSQIDFSAAWPEKTPLTKQKRRRRHT